jgi:hypothetical protein
MYIHEAEPHQLRRLDGGAGWSTYADSPLAFVLLKRSMIQPLGRLSPRKFVVDDQSFAGRKHHYVRSWNGHAPSVIEVQKAEVDWLANRVQRVYNEYCTNATGVGRTVVIP